MRIRLRPAEHLVDSLDQAIADHVLELFGLVVHLVPGIPMNCTRNSSMSRWRRRTSAASFSPADVSATPA